MKRPSRPFIGGFLSGAICCGAVTGYFGLRAVVHAQRTTDVACASIAADALASFKTGDSATAERHLEQQLDLGVLMAKVQSTGSPIGRFLWGPLSETQVDALSRVKYYRKAFPSPRPNGVSTDVFLANFPDLVVLPDPACSSGFCRIAEKLKQDAK
jgi:hypothetical protein